MSLREKLMVFDNVRLKEEVDKVFAPEERTNAVPIAFAYERGMTSNSYPGTSFAKNLVEAHRSLPEEDYEKLAEAVTKDERINKFLPYIALDAMGANAFWTARHSMANLKVDTNGGFGISKTELEAASKDNKHFDPVYRKGLTFAAENFDKFRSLNPNDGFPTTWIGGDSNYRNISYADLGLADEQLVQYTELPARITANETILNNFDAIDASNGSGKITNGEGLRWINDFTPAATRVELIKLVNELPSTSSERLMSSSEELSKIDYQTKIADLKKEQADIAKLWGWERK